MLNRPKSETEVAASVAKWLAEREWTVYQEVRLDYLGKRADLVAVQGALVWVIETKLSLSLDLLDQAAYWSHYAHFTSIGVPKMKLRSGVFSNNARYWILEHFGLGVFEVERDGWVREAMRPALHRRASARELKDVLCDEMKTCCPAGSAGGGYWTEFKRTVQNVQEFVGKHPGCTFKEMVDAVEHHYRNNSNARATLSMWVRAGKVPGVRIVKEGRTARLFPESTPATLLELAEKGENS